jgi:hypothetical protein
MYVYEPFLALKCLVQMLDDRVNVNEQNRFVVMVMASAKRETWERITH